MKTLKLNISLFALILFFSTASFGQTVLTSLDGQRIDVESQSGRVVVLSVGATWLPLSGKQAEITNTLVKKYAGRPVVFYFVATDSNNPRSKNFASDADIRQFAAANKITVGILRDPDAALTIKNLGIEQVPSFIILDKKGTPATEPFGGLDPKYDLSIPISRAIDKIL